MQLSTPYPEIPAWSPTWYWKMQSGSLAPFPWQLPAGLTWHTGESSSSTWRGKVPSHPWVVPPGHQAKSDRSPDVPEPNMQARRCTCVSVARAENRRSSASRGKGAMGRGQRQEKQMAQLCANTPRGLPNPVLLHTCPLRCVKVCIYQEFMSTRAAPGTGGGWKVEGAIAQGASKDGQGMLMSQVTKTIAGGTGNPINAFRNTVWNFFFFWPCNMWNLSFPTRD